MPILPVLTIPNPLLKRKALPVEKIEQRHREIIQDMLDTMYDRKGVGLAATQVGIDARIVVIDLQKPDIDLPVYKMINPEIVWKSEEKNTKEEGCLSVPGFYNDVTRSLEIKVKYQDENGEHHELRTAGILAVCIQHEIDHLDGILFIDYLSELKKSIALKKVKKRLREMEEAV